MAYEARHMKPQVKALLIEAMGPLCPELHIDEFTSVEAAKKEMRRRYNHAMKGNEDFLKHWGGAFIETDHALLDADDDKYEWQVYRIGI